jgi:hypothetical protein
MADMRYTEDELRERAHPSPIEAVRNDHPWGLCIHLTERELKLLGIDKEDTCAVGDLIHLAVMGKVTHCSDSENNGRDIELRLVEILHWEDENKEGEDDDA